MGMYGHLMQLTPDEVHALFQAAEQGPAGKAGAFPIDDRMLDAVLGHLFSAETPNLPPALAEALRQHPEAAARLKQDPTFREAMRAHLAGGGKPQRGNVRGFLDSRLRRPVKPKRAGGKAKGSSPSRKASTGKRSGQVSAADLLSEMRAMDEKYRATGLFGRMRSGAPSEADLRLLEQRNQDFMALVAKSNPRYAQAQQKLEAFEAKLKADGTFEEIRRGHTGGKVSPKHRAAFEKHKKLFQAQMQGLAPGNKDFVEGGEDPDPDLLDLGKDWHLLHYLLTGRAEGGEPPLADAILGGQEIGEDLGYGPARFLTPEKVRAVAEALAKVSPQELRARSDPAKMREAGIYGASYPAAPGPEGFDPLLRFLERLRRFYRDAAKRGNAMLLYVE